MSRFLREIDRDANCYPALRFPELYLLKGGYKAFYYKHKVSQLWGMINVSPWKRIHKSLIPSRSRVIAIVSRWHVLIAVGCSVSVTVNTCWLWYKLLLLLFPRSSVSHRPTSRCRMKTISRSWGSSGLAPSHGLERRIPNMVAWGASICERPSAQQLWTSEGPSG